MSRKIWRGLTSQLLWPPRLWGATRGADDWGRCADANASRAWGQAVDDDHRFAHTNAPRAWELSQYCYNPRRGHGPAPPRLGVGEYSHPPLHGSRRRARDRPVPRECPRLDDRGPALGHSPLGARRIVALGGGRVGNLDGILSRSDPIAVGFPQSSTTHPGS